MEKTDEELQMLAGSVGDLGWYRKNLDDIQTKFNGKAVAIKQKAIIGSSVDAQTLIDVALWTFWVYAVIRYAQYFREDGLPKLRAARAHISLQSFQQQLTRFVNEINREIRGTFTYDALHKAGWFNRVFHGIVYNPDKGGGDDPVQVTIPRGLWMKERVHTYARLLLHTSVT